MAVNGNHSKHRPTRKGCKCFHCIGYTAKGADYFRGMARVNAATRRALESAQTQAEDEFYTCPDCSDTRTTGTQCGCQFQDDY